MSNNILIAKAVAALETSVGSILNCGDDDETKRFALAESFSQFEAYIRNGVGSDVAKASRSGPQSLSAALLNHLHDALGRKRQRHGFEKSAKVEPMDTVHSIMKDCGGPVAFAKTICDTGRSYGVSESAYVDAAGRYAGEMYGLPRDRAFAKLCESDGSVMRACGVLKAAEFSAFDISPVVVGATQAQDVDNATAAVRATEEIVRIGREKFPFLSADQQFARIFEDKNYAALASQAHSRPQPTTIYRMPGSDDPGRDAYTKSDPLPNADTAYSALLAKAREYRTAHPELTESQAFARIYSDRGNVELAKRERVENAVR